MKSLYINLAYKFLALALLLFFFAGTAFAADLAADANIFMYPKPFKIADLRLQNTSGQMVSLADFKGKVVLLHFWSIRCPACRMEEPLLHRGQEEYGPAGLEILWVDLVDPPQAVAEHAATNRMPIPVLHGSSHGASLRVVNVGSKTTAFVVNLAMEAILEVPAFPTTYIIDCTGSAVGYSVGSARWNDKSAVGLIQALLAQRKTCASNSFMPVQKRYSMR